MAGAAGGTTLQALHPQAQGQRRGRSPGAPPWVPKHKKARTLKAFHSRATNTSCVTRQPERRWYPMEWNAFSVRETQARSPRVGLRDLRPRRPALGFGMQRLQRIKPPAMQRLRRCKPVCNATPVALCSCLWYCLIVCWHPKTAQLQRPGSVESCRDAHAVAIPLVVGRARRGRAVPLI